MNALMFIAMLGFFFSFHFLWAFFILFIIIASGDL